MPRRKVLQTNFSAGELAPDLAMRQDTDQYKNGAKSLLNKRVLIGGGVVRRPGSTYQATLTGPGILAEFIVNQTTQYVLVFNSGRMDAYLRNTTTGVLTASGSLTSMPWTGTIFKEMDWVQRGNTIFLVHPIMWPQVITRTGAATWARADLTFSIGSSSRVEQPYLKTAAAAVTLQPSALTGAITITATGGAPILPGHVGMYLRYLGKAMLVTGYTSSTVLSATVIETLPTTQTLTVTSSANFALDEVVTGYTSAAKGIVAGIPDATHLTVVISHGLTPFQAEDIIGPNGKTAISAVATATPAAIKDWDEQLFTSIHGFPSCVELHRNRLCFGGHPAAPDYLICSSLYDIYNFTLGTGGDADGIMESIGDAGASKIVQLFSAEQLIVLTDRGPYYCPESGTQPFRPSSMAFYPFGSPWPITATAQAQAFDGGVVMVSGSIMIKARPTGNVSAQWDADEVSLLAPHLVKTPTRLSVTSNFGGNPERYTTAVNSDGTLAVMQLVEVQKIRNFTPWQTAGTYISTCSILGDIYAVVVRSSPFGYFLERFDQNVTLDCATTYVTEAAMTSGVASRYGSAAVHVVAANYYLGTYPPTLTVLPAGPYTVGLTYDSTIQTLPPVIQGQEGEEAGDYMRLVEAYVHVISSARFANNGTELQAYAVADDMSLPPSLKNGPQRFQFTGWKREPTMTITQPDPLAMKVLAIRTTVAF